MTDMILGTDEGLDEALTAIEGEDFSKFDGWFARVLAKVERWSGAIYEGEVVHPGSAANVQLAAATFGRLVAFADDPRLADGARTYLSRQMARSSDGEWWVLGRPVRANSPQQIGRVALLQALAAVNPDNFCNVRPIGA